MKLTKDLYFLLKSASETDKDENASRVIVEDLKRILRGVVNKSTIENVK